MLYNMMLFQAKTEKDQGLSRFPGRDSCGAVKNLRFLNSPITFAGIDNCGAAPKSQTFRTAPS
jgi:hypothetical protein